MEDNTKTVQMPVDKMSYSGLTQLLRNPIIFKLKYILGVYDTKKSVSSMIGSAVHEALKFYYGGNPDRPVPMDRTEAIADAMQIGIEYIENVSDAYIKYGKTGSREEMLKGYHQAMTFYFTEEPEYNEILICEERLEAEIKTHDGYQLPIPAVGHPDLVHRRKDGGVEIIDNKVVKSFTSYENEDGEPFEDFVKIVQAKFLDRLLFATKGIKADRVLFREIKRTANRDEKPQIRDYVVPLAHEPYDIIFDNLYTDAVKFISNPNAVYLPNLSDAFDGEQAGLLYAQGLLSSDMSDVEVMHKVKDVAFISKKFIPSRLDKIENTHLPPEEKIKLRMAEFGIPIQPVQTVNGPSVVQYQFKISAGVRMSSFAKHKSDIARAIEAKGEIRILTPIPGTSLLGIEVATEKREPIYLETKHFKKGTLNIPIGVNTNGETVSIQLDKMPHLLIAGETGSGKSITLHCILTALIKQMPAKDMKMTLIDPKRVELVSFAKIPHLKNKKIIYEYEDAVRSLMATVDLMEKRYEILEKNLCRDIGEYNKKKPESKMDYQVIVIDEFADFMMRNKIEEKRQGISYTSKTKGWLYKELVKRGGKQGTIFVKDEHGEVKGMEIMGMRSYDKDGIIDLLEQHDLLDEMKRGDANIELLVTRIAQMGRAAGIHAIIATQRPSVDVITGLIKANFPTRIALRTSSAIDSSIILGQAGSEKLSGDGDMLLMHPGMQGLTRLQGFMKQ